MSGDIGAGTARRPSTCCSGAGVSCRLALQLAGGTNHDSGRRLEREGLAPAVAGIAYGGSARKLDPTAVAAGASAGRRCALALIYGAGLGAAAAPLLGS